jgi:hypothetical protein
MKIFRVLLKEPVLPKNRGNACTFGFNGKEKLKNYYSTIETYLVNQVKDLQVDIERFHPIG